MAGTRVMFIMFLLAFIWVINAQHANGALTSELVREIEKVNKQGPYLGLVIPNTFELNPLLQSPNYTCSNKTIDFAGKRFRFGAIGDKPVILVMTGLGMINAAITTQLLLSFFKLIGVVHYGTAGGVNPYLNFGDVVIPQYWAHFGLWSWQRYGQGPKDELPLEADGDYTREIGYLNFANYTTNISDGISYDNLLNNIWYQPEEIFLVDGTPEQRQHAFWVPIDSLYFQISQKLEDIKLEKCINSTTCLLNTPKVVRVQRGASASIFLSNEAYKTFIHNNFNVDLVDMESASVALICLQQRVPFIAIRAVSGSRSALPFKFDASTFLNLASTNSVTVVVEFIRLLSLSLKWSM
ncbi:bark storage protein A-like [Gastrolobium bilobum]|uniref:bark storage protein A-like n=1 Tax=Gastrolobium bilobum TaxID=150636 RepID=UPI002AAF340F|nr:bark storage protein A-like [Gastrolobium bilobum]